MAGCALSRQGPSRVPKLCGGGAWPTWPRTWWIECFRRCLSVNGCSRSPSRCAPWQPSAPMRSPLSRGSWSRPSSRGTGRAPSALGFARRKQGHDARTEIRGLNQPQRAPARHAARRCLHAWRAGSGSFSPRPPPTRADLAEVARRVHRRVSSWLDVARLGPRAVSVWRAAPEQARTRERHVRHLPLDKVDTVFPVGNGTWRLTLNAWQ